MLLTCEQKRSTDTSPSASGLLMLSLTRYGLWYGVALHCTRCHRDFIASQRRNMPSCNLKFHSIPQILKPVLGQLTAAGVPPKKKIIEFKVTENAILAPGMVWCFNVV